MLTGTLPFPADTAQEAMVKRLTDEPAELMEVRPNLRFPAGLQAILDTALARNPVERYQSAAKFAHDLATVLGLSPMASGALLPSTQADAEDETELLQPVRARRRSLVPIVVGVVVALVGAGAVVTVGRNVRGTGSVPPADTARAVAVPPLVDTASRAPVAPPRRAPARRPQAPVTRARIDVARARGLLDALADSLAPKNASMVRDSAQHIFDAAGMTQTDKAYAAYVLGTAYLQLDKRSQGCEWIRVAAQLDPSKAFYGDLYARCRS
jgi:hypothetical protein